MASILRIKRSLSEEPTEAIVVSFKRARTEQQCSDGGDGKEEVQKIFRLAATVKNKDENVTDLVKPSLKKSVKTHTSNIKTHIREEFCDSSKNNRYKVISTHRGLEPQQLNEDNNKPSSLESHFPAGFESEALKCLYRLYDIIEEKTLKNEEDVKIITRDDTITCNGVEMVREHVDTESSKPNGYVYDLYYIENDEMGADFADDIVNIEKYLVNPMYENAQLREEFNSDEEDDSNDECNWRNDYPEEDSDFENKYDYYDDREDDDEEENLRRAIDKFNMTDSDESDEDNPLVFSRTAVDESDIFNHGTAYAKFKAKYKANLKEEDSEEDSD